MASEARTMKTGVMGRPAVIPGSTLTETAVLLRMAVEDVWGLLPSIV
jgi:hypothetical protein